MGKPDKRYVIQKHTRDEDVHWDLMLEVGDVLETYRLEKRPDEVPGSAVNATRIFDHPLRFLTYQGPVNRGRGRVEITESGTYDMTESGGDRVRLSLNGKVLKGDFLLTRIRGDKWLFSKEEHSRS